MLSRNLNKANVKDAWKRTLGCQLVSVVNGIRRCENPEHICDVERLKKFQLYTFSMQSPLALALLEIALINVFVDAKKGHASMPGCRVFGVGCGWRRR